MRCRNELNIRVNQKKYNDCSRGWLFPQIFHRSELMSVRVWKNYESSFWCCKSSKWLPALMYHLVSITVPNLWNTLHKVPTLLTCVLSLEHKLATSKALASV